MPLLSRCDNSRLCNESADDAFFVYVVTHCRIATHSLVAKSLAYSTTQYLCDVVVVPFKPLAVGMTLSLIPLVEAEEVGNWTREATPQKWSTGECEVDGRIVGVRSYEQDTIEFIVQNNAKYREKFGISYAYVNVAYDRRFVSKLDWKRRTIRRALYTFRLLPATRSLSTMTTEELRGRLCSGTSPTGSVHDSDDAPADGEEVGPNVEVEAVTCLAVHSRPLSPRPLSPVCRSIPAVVAPSMHDRQSQESGASQITLPSNLWLPRRSTLGIRSGRRVEPIRVSVAVAKLGEEREDDAGSVYSGDEYERFR